jgi:anaerobic magnesium-protoporphyrin IX monomethyl ester cyclase
VRPVLIYPPVTDPTSGYHSLCYLDSYARAQGLPAADLVDANIEAFHYSYTDRAAAWLAAERADPRWAADVRDYQGGPAVTAAHLLRVAEPDPAGVRAAVGTLRDPVAFYDLDSYRPAIDTVMSWLNYLGSVGFPGQFRSGFQPIQTPVRTRSVRSLTDLRALARLSAPFQPYYEDVLLPRLVAGGYGLVGVNVTFEWQLPFALWLMHLVRGRLPAAFLVAGGTGVSDVWKYAREKSAVFEIFADLDAVVVGEGETAYADILRSVSAGSVPRGHPNIRLHPKYKAGRLLPVFRYENLADLPTPDYSRLPWDLYLSPERFVYYSPTRGCYWNKCTFCDYGLNGDSPTSPWRQEPVDRMLRDVTALAEFSRFIYFSVDVLAPATILRFAERVIDAGLDIRWGAEIRLEKHWSPERCEVLRRSGCTAVAVGFESGNQRIIDLIDKGTTPDRVRQTISALSGAGIGVQMMAFTGFPTETVDEARDTIAFLEDNRSRWTFGGLGEFALTAGSIAARQPDRFGISNLRPIEDGDDIVVALGYDDPTGNASLGDPEIAAARSRLNDDHCLGRPWVGATEAAHSYFFHDRHGTAAHDVLVRHLTVTEADQTRLFVLNGEILDRPAEDVLAEYVRRYGRAGRPVPGSPRLFRRADGTILLAPGGTYRVLALFRTPTTLAAARRRLWLLPDVAVATLWTALVGQRFLRRCARSAGAGSPAEPAAPQLAPVAGRPELAFGAGR